MPLPTINLPRETVTLSDGSAVGVRGLTRAEVMHMSEVEGPREIEINVLAYGTDTPYDEAAAWYAATPSDDVDCITKTVYALSRIGDDEGKGSSGD